MALTRSFLKSMNLTDEQVTAIIEAHAESIEGLTQKRDEYKAKANQADELTRQLNEANEKLAQSGDAARIQQEFDDYKAGIEAEKTAAQNRSVMDVFLRDQVGVKRESARKLILDAMDLNKYPQENGQLKNAETVASELKTQYADFVSTTEEKGAPPVNPPGGGSGVKKTREEIEKITDSEARRAAIRDNIELFE